MTNSRAGKGSAMLVNEMVTQTANLTRYYALAGGPATATESLTEATLEQSKTLTSISLRVGVNSVSATSTYSFRDDGADVQTIAITSNTTGTYESNGNSLNIDAGSLINHKLITGATGTTLTIYSILVQFG